MSASGTAVVTAGTLYTNANNATLDSISGGTFAFSNANAGSGTKTVTTTGVTVTDGNSGGNYSVIYTDNTTSTINPSIVNLTGTRVYDGTVNVAASGLTLGTLVGGQTLSLSGTGTVANKNVGTAKAITLGSLALVDGTGLASNYTFVGGTQTTDITVAPLTISSSDVTKAYNGTLAALGTAVASSGTVFTGDSLSGGTFAFTNANAGSGNKTVTTTGVTVVDGNSGNNYSVSYADNITSTITPANLTFSSPNTFKVYDGGVTSSGTAILVSGTLYTNVSNGSVVDNFTGGTFEYLDPNVGLGNKTVIASVGVTLNDGNSGGNYNIIYTNNTTSTINPYAVSLTGTRTYDGTLTVAASGLTFSTLVGGETLTLNGAGTVANKNVGTAKTVTLGTLALGNGTGLASNYTFTGGTQTTDITAASLSVTTSDVSKTYNGTLAAMGTAVAVSGTVFSGDSLSGGTFAFTNANAGSGNKIVTTSSATLTDGNSGNNYSISYVDNTTSTISPANLSVGSSNVAKTYDGGISASGTAVVTAGTLYTNVSNGSVLDTISGGTFVFSNAGAGSGTKTLTTSGVTVTDGNSGGNYNLTYSNNTTSTISPAVLTLTPIADDKFYDGSNLATFNSYGLAGFIGTETLTATFTGATFSDKNAAVGKTVTLSGIALVDGTNGGLATNYTVPTTATTTATITPKELSLAATVADKTYNGNSGATLTGYGLSGFVGSETVVPLYSGSVTFADKHVGVAKTVTITGINLFNGTGGGLASNYSVANSTTSTATITQATLTVAGIVGVDKVYDGTLAAGTNSIIAALTGAVGGDDVQVGAISGTFLTKDVGVNKPIIGSSFVLTGSDGPNYNLIQPTGLVASITPRALTVSAIGVNKVYDGLANATVTITDNRVSGDILGVSYSAAFADKNAGAGKFVAVSGINLSGTDAGNYVANSIAGTSAAITPATLTINASGVDKSYDATTAATVVLTDDRLNGDFFNIGYGSAAYIDKNVGIAKTINITDIALSGADAGNYSVSGTAVATASISPIDLTVTATGADKVYDGTRAFGANAVAVLTGVIAADDAYIGSITGMFASKDVGVNKPVTGSTFTLSGNDAQNYNLIQPTSLSASITPRPLLISAAGINKVYDGSANASVAISDDRASGDVLAISYNAVFADKNAGAGKFVTVSGINLTGTDAGNYVANTSADASAAITPAILTVSAAGVDKVYDASTAVAVTLTDDRLTGDVFTLGYGNAAFNDKNVGANKLVTLSGVSLSGADAGNYSAIDALTTTASISPINLSVTAAGVDKIFDGTDSATVDLTAVPLSGDVLDVSYQAARFDNNLTGSNKTVNVSGISVSGLDSANYRVNSTAATAANIIPNTDNIITATVISLVNGAVTELSSADWMPTALVDVLALFPESSMNGINNNIAAKIGSGVTKPVNDEVQVLLIQEPLWDGSSTADNNKIFVTVPRGSQKFASGLTFSLPLEAMNVTGLTMVQATRVNGKSLPSWLRFAPESNSFIVNTTIAAFLPYKIKVTIGEKQWIVTIQERDE